MAQMLSRQVSPTPPKPWHSAFQHSSRLRLLLDERRQGRRRSGAALAAAAPAAIGLHHARAQRAGRRRRRRRRPPRLQRLQGRAHAQPSCLERPDVLDAVQLATLKYSRHALVVSGRVLTARRCSDHVRAQIITTRLDPAALPAPRRARARAARRLRRSPRARQAPRRAGSLALALCSSRCRSLGSRAPGRVRCRRPLCGRSAAARDRRSELALEELAAARARARLRARRVPVLALQVCLRGPARVRMGVSGSAPCMTMRTMTWLALQEATRSEALRTR